MIEEEKLQSKEFDKRVKTTKINNRRKIRAYFNLNKKTLILFSTFLLILFLGISIATFCFNRTNRKNDPIFTGFKNTDYNVSEILKNNNTLDSTTEDSVNENSILGNWNLGENENADEYLRAVGLSFLKRKLSFLTKQTLFISKIGSNWFTILSIHLPIGITIKNTINCTEGIEFYHVTPDDREVKTTIYTTGSLKKIIQEERDPKTNELVGIITHEVNDNDQLIGILRFKDVESRRLYSRI